MQEELDLSDQWEHQDMLDLQVTQENLEQLVHLGFLGQ